MWLYFHGDKSVFWWLLNGGLAQLAERMHRTHEAIGSNPISSTKKKREFRKELFGEVTERFMAAVLKTVEV